MKITCYIACSQDGFIASTDGSVAFLDQFNEIADQCEHCSFHDFIQLIDSVVIGRITYKQMVGFGDLPYQNKKTFVVGSKAVSTHHENIIFLSNIYLSIGAKPMEEWTVHRVSGQELINLADMSGNNTNDL
jgi:dihydrofolate reductase